MHSFPENTRTWFRNANHWYPWTSWQLGFNPKASWAWGRSLRWGVWGMKLPIKTEILVGWSLPNNFWISVQNRPYLKKIKITKTENWFFIHFSTLRIFNANIWPFLTEAGWGSTCLSLGRPANIYDASIHYRQISLSKHKREQYVICEILDGWLGTQSPYLPS